MNEILNPQSYFSPRFDLPYKKRILYLADTRRQNAGNSTVCASGGITKEYKYSTCTVFVL